MKVILALIYWLIMCIGSVYNTMNNMSHKKCYFSFRIMCSMVMIWRLFGQYHSSQEYGQTGCKGSWLGSSEALSSLGSQRFPGRNLHFGHVLWITGNLRAMLHHMFIQEAVHQGQTCISTEDAQKK